MDKKPLKRHTALQPVSRDHHHGLLLSWKIRQGFKLNVEPARIKKYVDWFWSSHLRHHFEIEEKFIFPVLGDTHESVRRALAEHSMLAGLFEAPAEDTEALHRIEKELDQHIRFEERVLFTEVQEVATPEQYEQIRQAHESGFEENWPDPFWEKQA